MLRGQPPTVFGDGEQSRDFTYVDNAVAANLLASTAAQAAGNVFNIATGHQVTLNQTLAVLRRIIGYEGSVLYSEHRAGDIKHSLADISLETNHLGYRPTVDFEAGLRRTVSWYRQQVELANAAAKSTAKLGS